jgi:hypothetical protein
MPLRVVFSMRRERCTRGFLRSDPPDPGFVTSTIRVRGEELGRGHGVDGAEDDVELVRGDAAIDRILREARPDELPPGDHSMTPRNEIREPGIEGGGRVAFPAHIAV